jgi:hypothetical protein
MADKALPDLTAAATLDGSELTYITQGGNSRKLVLSALNVLYQPLDSDLTTIAGLTATTDNFIVSVASAWASRTPAQVRTTLGLVIGTNVQAFDALLLSIAGLTFGADNFIYGTGSDTAAAGTITSFGRSLVDDADATAARVTLGLVIGTNVQAYDADLTTWAGITPGTGVGTALAVNVGSAGAFVTFNGALGTPSSATLSNATGLPIAGLVASTSTPIGVGSIELGNSSDTTITRTGAGDIAVEGNAVYRAGGTDVPVTDGGTGSSTASGARTNLGLGTSATVNTGTSGATIPLLNAANTFGALQTFSSGGDLTPAAAPSTTSLGYLGAPQNLGLDSGNVTLALTDCGKHIYHSDGNTRTLTIPANGSVAFPVGTVIAGVNENGAGVLTIAITTDTLRWGSSTGSRSVAANGSWTLLKVASTLWRLTGDGIT